MHIDYEGKISLVFMDDLTQIYNRRFIYKRLPLIMEQAKSLNQKASLFMIDVDNFKNINDRFGHLEGDKVLVELASGIKEYVGRDGIVARYAGDEFIVMLPGQDEEQSSKVADVILKNVSDQKMQMKDGTAITMGISIGRSVYPDDAGSLQDLINQADQALYASKKAGKNRAFSSKDVQAKTEVSANLEKVFLRPPFVNRSQELRNLKDAYEASKAGRKQAVLIRGEAGVGKTRLLEEFAIWAAAHDACLVSFEFRQFEESGLLAGMAELLRKVSDAVDPDRLKDILAKLPNNELAEVLYLNPKLKSLAAEQPYTAPPEEKVVNLFSALRKMLTAIAGERAFVLAVDNLHWADRLILQFALNLMKSREIEKFLFLGLYSKSDLAGPKAPLEELLKSPFSKKLFQMMELKPLLKEDVTQLIASIFPGIKPKPQLIEGLSKTSRGNPLLLSEILRAMTQEGSIQYEDNKWNLRAFRPKEAPASLEGLARRGFENLDEETKNILSQASVMGKSFEIDMLKKLSGQNEGYILELLDRASRAGLIDPMSTDYDSASFRTGSARDTFVNAIPPEEAMAIHQRFAELIERYYKDSLHTQLGRLMHHIDLSKGKTASSKYASLNKQMAKDYTLPSGLVDLLKEIEIEEPGEMAVSIEEMLEQPLSKASVRIIKDLTYAVRAAIMSAVLYPPDNNLRIDLENKAYEMAFEVLKNERTLTFTDAEGRLLVNGQDLKEIDAKTTLGVAFTNMMMDHGITSMTLKQGLEKAELARFFNCFSKSREEMIEAGGLSEIIKSENIVHVKIDAVKYEKVSKRLKRAIGIDELRAIDEVLRSKMGGGFSPSELIEGIMKKPVEEYSKLKALEKFNVIAEEMLATKNDNVLEQMLGKMAEDLKTSGSRGSFVLCDIFKQISMPLIKHEKFQLSQVLADALMGRFRATDDSQEVADICESLQTIANNLINEQRFGQARKIIKQFKEHMAAGSGITEAKKKIAKEELGKIAHPKVIETLMNSLKRKMESNYKDVMGILTELGEYAIGPLVELLIQKEDTKSDPFELFAMRRSITTILKNIGSPALDALKKLLSDPRAHVVRNVVEAIGYLGSEDIAPLLAPSLQSGYLEVRKECVSSLKRIGGRESLKLLAGALKDRDAEVKRRAAAAITETADSNFIKELEPLLKDESLRDLVRSIIGRIQQTKPRI